MPDRSREPLVGDASIQELLDALAAKPESQCYVQVLRPSITNVISIRGRGHLGGSKVTFLTNQISPGDIVTNAGKAAFVLWIDPARLA